MINPVVNLARWKPDRLTDLLLRGTVTLSPDDQALLLSSPTPPAFSTTQPEHVPGPETHTISTSEGSDSCYDRQ